MGGYHTKEIKKEKYGTIFKIEEEWNELKDAHLQDDKILELCELSDIVGAIEGYVTEKYNMSLEDLIKFSNKTKEAFRSGKRV